MNDWIISICQNRPGAICWRIPPPMQSYQGHPGDPEWSKYSSSHPTMISTILNELSVQIVSDPFPKPKPLQASQCQSPCTNQVQAFRSFLFLTSIIVHKTNTNFTGIFVPSFYPSLLSSKHKHKFNRHFCSFLFIPSLS